MKNAVLYVLTCLASLSALSLGRAQSAEPVAMPNVAPCPCSKAFQGFHLGGHIGYEMTRATTTNLLGRLSLSPTPPPPTSVTLQRNNTVGIHGVEGGLTMGYTHRFDNVGLGIEGVFSWSSTQGKFALGLDSMMVSDTVRLYNSLQLRTYLSYIICNLVAPKIILGWDNSEWQRRILVTSPTTGPFSAESKKRYNGLLWGVGVDFLMAKHIIAGVEYTGTLSEKRDFEIAQVSPTRFSLRPQSNKVALTLKFIY